nr:unnamed protein product [Callosobruchus analis]
MGTLLKSAVNTAYSSEVQRENCNRDRQEELKALNILIGTDWADEISSEAGQNLNVNKFNKPTLIPMAEDIKKFEAYLNEILQKAKELLTENPSDKKAFRDLVDGTFCRVLLFNRRRVGDRKGRQLQVSKVKCLSINEWQRRGKKYYMVALIQNEITKEEYNLRGG